MKKKSLLFKVIAFLGIVIIICMILMIPPVGDKVGAMVGWAGMKVRAVAGIVAGIAVGALMVLAGIAFVGAMPIVAGIVALAGLGMIIWNVYPLFMSSANNG